jgi:hypothetical protein
MEQNIENINNVNRLNDETSSMIKDTQEASQELFRCLDDMIK